MSTFTLTQHSEPLDKFCWWCGEQATDSIEGSLAIYYACHPHRQEFADIVARFTDSELITGKEVQ